MPKILLRLSRLGTWNLAAHSVARRRCRRRRMRGRARQKPDVGQWDERDLKWAIRVRPRGLVRKGWAVEKAKQANMVW
ncbi:hypothetical protein I7I50_08742 [Histoplasma capsulatum G186AR]|uniref:Uncharacterized protein n=1 Tax=Ajellomyces capsulatus TaxID=5037 RepID=A0A8H7YRG0_AJECA|nr:hypothetical protein I7I52_06256 [Histoplasma capsulatum]QSS73824.1 hypothetical protein I7I50_08742 [Histoplasma capsulatum G186AR]